MACSAVRSPLLRNPVVRNYAVAAAAQCAPTTCADIKVLPSKITLAAVNNNNPITQVSIIFRAGSRNETYETQGTSHMLRLCTALTNSNSSAFMLTRKVQQLGGELTTTADREFISYTLRIHRDNLFEAYPFLEDAAYKQEFRPWELSDEEPKLRYEASTVPDFARLFDLLYKAAYREGLGYPLYIPKRNIGKINSESLSHFVKNNFTSSRCAVIATGIPLSEAECLATSINLPSNDCKTAPSKYFGGEIRKDRNSELANIAVAVEGSGLNNRKELMAFAVLQKLAGEGTHVKWGDSHAPLYKAVSSATKDPFAVVSFNTNHTDSGLFGIIVSSPAQSAGSVLKAGVKWLRSPTFSDDDVRKGKNSLKLAVLSAGDRNILLHENIGQQVLFTGSVISTQAIADEIDKITPSDVKNVANKVSKGKLSLAAIGNLGKVPYLDQL